MPKRSSLLHIHSISASDQSSRRSAKQSDEWCGIKVLFYNSWPFGISPVSLVGFHTVFFSLDNVESFYFNGIVVLNFTKDLHAILEIKIVLTLVWKKRGSRTNMCLLKLNILAKNQASGQQHSSLPKLLLFRIQFAENVCAENENRGFYWLIQAPYLEDLTAKPCVNLLLHFSSTQRINLQKEDMNRANGTISVSLCTAKTAANITFRPPSLLNSLKIR